VAVALLGLGWAAGCELVLGKLPPVQGAGGGAGGHEATSASATSGSGGGHVTSSVASSTSVASSSGACCDCDDDHFEAEGQCGGKDCDDHDSRVYPGEPIYYAMPSPNPAVGFDWDCSGKADPNPALDVAVDCTSLLMDCDAGPAYLGTAPPPCGVGAPWGRCAAVPLPGLGCENAVIVQSQVMTCK
jgi:hypothetical protein